ncbi:MAG: DUF3524 domain-containing protein [Myxococcota bacterium]|nr:DUF3524 domain-containing protein [Myxococcota bacterium]
MKLLYVEPFDGGSHGQFTRTLTEQVSADWTVLTLPGRHWKWRARGSAVYFAEHYSDVLKQRFDGLWAGSFLPLQDLVALVPSLAGMPRVLYFHENQLAYPMRPQWSGERDNHFGLSQMISALVSTKCLFNSTWNLSSFLDAGRALLKKMPDAIPHTWIDRIQAKSEVLPIPLNFGAMPSLVTDADEDRTEGPTILWNHRWEHDKNPEAFFETLVALKAKKIPFRLVVCGQRYRRYPPIFDDAKNVLNDRIDHWGTVDSRADYEALLRTCHIAVSTAHHEFFGIAMLEATHFGAYPLVPERLSYPELFPVEHRYADDHVLRSRLASLCTEWVAGHCNLRANRTEITKPFGAPLLDRYHTLIRETFMKT